MDKTPDYLDTDSDDDTILDKDERAIDPDMDGKMSYVDDDSDGDCVLDANEAGDSDPKTAPVDTDGDDKPDFHDRDSDDDGLADGAEDANCNGMQDGDESSPQDADSDDDGVSDLIEKAAGTNPNDPMDNPQAKGDFVFVVPFEEDPTPKDDDLDFSTSLQQVDVFVLLDRSGSMTRKSIPSRRTFSRSPTRWPARLHPRCRRRVAFPIFGGEPEPWVTPAQTDSRLPPTSNCNPIPLRSAPPFRRMSRADAALNRCCWGFGRR